MGCVLTSGTPLHWTPDILLLLSQLPMVVCVAWEEWQGPLLLINLEKNNRILLSVKRTMKEGKETYLLCFETLSNTSIGCRTHRTCMTWHGCSHGCCYLVWLKGFGSGWGGHLHWRGHGGHGGERGGRREDSSHGWGKV
jgi:hypothetical protein